MDGRGPGPRGTCPLAALLLAAAAMAIDTVFVVDGPTRMGQQFASGCSNCTSYSWSSSSLVATTANAYDDGRIGLQFRVNATPGASFSTATLSLYATTLGWVKGNLYTTDSGNLAAYTNGSYNAVTSPCANLYMSLSVSERVR
jgi:hypothetical protein